MTEINNEHRKGVKHVYTIYVDADTKDEIMRIIKEIIQDDNRIVDRTGGTQCTLPAIDICAYLNEFEMLTKKLDLERKELFWS